MGSDTGSRRRILSSKTDISPVSKAPVESWRREKYKFKNIYGPEIGNALCVFFFKSPGRP